MLLVFVIVVWGLIGYRVVSALQPELPVQSAPKLVFNDTYNYQIKGDTFSIQKVNRDPFLGTIDIPKLQNKPKVKKQHRIVWKPIDYWGMIANRDSKDKVFIISISGNQVLVKKGQIIDSIKVLKGDAKKITLSYKGTKKTYKLKS